MDVDIFPNNLENLAYRAKQAADDVAKALGSADHGTDDQISANGLMRYVQKFRNLPQEDSLTFLYCDFLGLKKKLMSILVTRKDEHEHPVGRLIAINELLKDKVKPIQDKYLKYLLCHELAHVVYRHTGAGLVCPDTEDGGSPDIAAVLRAVWSYAPYFLDDNERELEAEIFATALGFYPRSEFIRLLKKHHFNFRTVANLFKMPVDCAIKWALLQLYEQTQMRYIKRNETTHDTKVIDCHWPNPAHHIHPDDDGASVFIPESAAYLASETREDQVNFEVDRTAGHENVSGAFFEAKENGFLRTFDKVLVVSMPRNLYEDFI